MVIDPVASGGDGGETDDLREQIDAEAPNSQGWGDVHPGMVGLPSANGSEDDKMAEDGEDDDGEGFTAEGLISISPAMYEHLGLTGYNATNAAACEAVQSLIEEEATELAASDTLHEKSRVPCQCARHCFSVYATCMQDFEETTKMADQLIAAKAALSPCPPARCPPFSRMPTP